jgi:hypothetical protein
LAQQQYLNLITNAHGNIEVNKNLLSVESMHLKHGNFPIDAYGNLMEFT